MQRGSSKRRSDKPVRDVKVERTRNPSTPARREIIRDALTPEVVDPRVQDVEALARFFDYAYRLPGGFRFGWAGVIGLIPGIGDLIDTLVSLYIITRAIQLGIPRVALARMLVNVGIEAVAGAAPFLGDLFNIGFKANRRNYLLLRTYVAEPGKQQTRDWWFLILTALILLAGLILPIIAIVYLLRRI
jgi:hypothetical protein